MFGGQECRIFSFLVLIVAAIARSPSDAPWTTFTRNSKVYQRSLGSASSGLNTITDPYSPKSSLSLKLVDPKTIKKTDMLTNMFTGTSDEFASTNNVLATQKRSLFGPFSPFNPMNPLSYGPYMGSYNSMMPNYYQSGPSTYGAGSYIPSDTSARRKRSIDNPELPKNLAPPPPYPALSPISEEQEELKSTRSAVDPSIPPKAPLQFLPPFGMFGPMVDPTMFIAKKQMFLDNLFKTLATSTPPPMTTDDTPTTKATIVPPDFWFPSSITPDPMEYSNKVVNFLDKLFDSLKMNKTTPTDDVIKNNFVRSLDFDSETQKKVARSLNDVAAISSAKDSIVDSILTELTDLKGDMITTLDDLVSFQKTSSSSSSKKSFKTGPWSKFTPDPTLPFKQRMAMIGQVFDMLTGLQRNITSAVQEAVNTKLDTQRPAYDVVTPGANINMTLLEAIKNKLTDYDPYSSIFGPSHSPKFSRTVPQTATSFWVAYPQDDSSNAVKRQVEVDALSKLYNEMSADERANEIKEQRPRAVEMEIHQGYQSMPPGTVESVQAGGGSTPGHEGGGINLLIQMPVSHSRAPVSENEPEHYWGEYSRNYGRNRHHHHNHH